MAVSTTFNLPQFLQNSGFVRDGNEWRKELDGSTRVIIYTPSPSNDHFFELGDTFTNESYTKISLSGGSSSAMIHGVICLLKSTV